MPFWIRRTASGFPEGFVLSELAGLNWSDDSDRIFVGIKEQADERDELEGRANVDVYHWADVQPQSVQEVRANRDRNRTWSSVVNLDGNRLSFVRLADESMESVSPAGTSQWGIGRDPRPYEYEVAWGGSKADYYRVNLDTGERAPWLRTSCARWGHPTTGPGGSISRMKRSSPGIWLRGRK